MSEETNSTEAATEAIAGGILKAFKPYFPYLAMLFLGGGVGAWNTHQDKQISHAVLWSEAGDHFQDIIGTNDLRWKTTQELSNRVAQLEHELENKTK